MHIPITVIGTDYTTQSILKLLQTNYPTMDFDYVLDVGENKRWLNHKDVNNHFESIVIRLEGSKLNIFDPKLHKRVPVIMEETKISYHIDSILVPSLINNCPTDLECAMYISDKISILDAHY